MAFGVCVFMCLFTVGVQITDVSGMTLTASENPLAVGKNVTLSLDPEMSLEEGNMLFETTTIVFWYPGRVRILNNASDRLSYNSTTSQLHIRSVTLNDSGLYTLQGIVPSLHTHLRLSVQEPISNVSVMVSGTHLVEFTDSVIFRCSALGTPQRYTWFNASSEVTAKNGVQLTENNSVLTISMVTRFDHGPFMCRVSNDINAQNSTLIFFNISYGPSDLKMTVEPQWPLYISGTNITLSCSAQSVPPATYYWTLNGTKINQHGPVLHLTESRQNQSGDYSCVAQNNITLRNETQTHTITVIDPVCVHDLGAMDGVPVENMNFSLMCHVTGPVDAIQWMKNGMDLYPDDRISLSNHNRTLTFGPVTRSDEGVFRCVAINAVSNSSSPDYTLTVNYGPSDLKMTVEPQWPLYISGTNITLSCSAQSVPPATYYWTLNGTKINQHGPVLHLTESRQNQSGDYSCVAQNNITLRNETQTHTITVIDPVCVHDLGAMDGVPVENMNFSLMCHVTGPVDAIQWMKNGMDLYPDDRISLSNHNRTLTFRPVTRSDEGVFRCVAINAVSNSSSPDYTLTVNHGPSDLKMTVEPQWPLHISGTNITLSCSAQSVPPAMYYWTLNGTKINQHGPVLHLTESRQNQSGDYSCVAQNNITLRNETQTHTITVIDPVCVHDLGAMDGVPVENMNFSLMCHVTGPVDSIRWMKNGMDLYPDDRISLSNHNRMLTFRPVTRSDEGVFRCVAINAVSNSSSPDYTLTVNHGPWQTVISGPEAAESNSTVTFNCSAISHPPSTYSWYFNGYWAADGPVYETEGLSVNSSGQYTCVAHNNVTMASHNASWELTVVEPISSVMVKPSTDLPLDSEELDLFCDVTGPFNRISWMKNGSPLTQSSAVSVSPDNTSVSFSSLRITDDGQYECVASNLVRDYHSEAYSLLVRYGPTDLVITVELGNPVVLRCKADSQPQSVYQWFFNDTEAGTGSRLPMHKLPVLGSAYTCEARNPDTNVTVSTSYIFTDPNTAPHHESMGLLLTVFVSLSLSLSVLG